MRGLPVAILLLAASCSGGAPVAQSAPAAPSPLPTAPPRTMNVTFSGGLTGGLTEVSPPRGDGRGSSICAGRLGSDPQGASYLMAALLGSDDVTLSFAIHGTQQPGTFVIGAYPDGSAAAPAVVNVLLFRVAFAAWNSGTGQLVIDPGGRSGTITADLPFTAWSKHGVADPPPPSTALPALHLFGTWLCPPGS